MPRTPTEKLLTVADVCERLGLAYDLVVRLIDSGQLMAINVGTGAKHRNFRIREEWLEEFLQARTTRAPVVVESRRRQARPKVLQVFK